MMSNSLLTKPPATAMADLSHLPPPPPSTALLTPAASQAVRLLTPIAQVAQILTNQQDVRDFITKVLRTGVDYAVIPGTDKPSLLQPGAQVIAGAFGLRPYPTILEHEVDHSILIDYIKRQKKWRNEFRGDREFTWLETPGNSRGLYRYVVVCELREIATGLVRGAGIAACSTLEAKYIDRPRDSENTVVQMAAKRAFVSAVRSTFALSDQFTQDMEDDPETTDEQVRITELRQQRQGLMPLASLEEALQVKVPGTKAPENPHGGDALADVPRKYQLHLLKWYTDRMQQAADQGGPEAVDVLDRYLATALTMVTAAAVPS